ncbi:winged helix-turn-helix domain-containing protein [Streptomyces canus]|uniref:winged helix-turn-helix domain-containing protein n=1 Tax=Streptomyces canus TaxID=58343 RepID=UPI00225A210B|nr:winged helix-turn-helix domain-containing protein [Streptomyces canus]
MADERFAGSSSGGAGYGTGRPAGDAVGGPALSRLREAQFAQLEAELAKGPVVHGRPDQRLTLARVKTVIDRRFRKSYTLQGVRKLLLRRDDGRRDGRKSFAWTGYPRPADHRPHAQLGSPIVLVSSAMRFKA